MRRAGLLVHAYLIYGFPGQSRSDIADSAEVCRQLFAADLVDSAFWHRFVLTRHSRMYADWRMGKRSGLAPIDRPWDFANNDLSFDGEGAYDEFDAPLATALEAWMSGDGLDRSAAHALGEAGLKSAREGVSVSPGFVESLVSKAEASWSEDEGRARWIAGKPILRAGRAGRASVSWAYRGEAISLELGSDEAERMVNAIASLADEASGPSIKDLRSGLALAEGVFSELERSGLVGV
jgi:hypothetical protein